MCVKDTRILKNGALAGYVYYSKEKKWKWRIIGRNEKSGGGKDEMIDELKAKGKYVEWEKLGSLFGYSNVDTEKTCKYKNMNGKTQSFSSIDNLYQEKEGRTIMPVFEWVEAIKRNKEEYNRWKIVDGRVRMMN
jgi:hypothetical protein